MENLNREHTLPNHFSILSPEDQQGYIDLKAMLCDSNRSNQKKNGLENFSDILTKIKHYTVNPVEDRWKRFLVCGIAWTENGYIGINTHQLQLLLGKCKSSINGSLHRLGYSALGFHGGSCSQLIDAIPFLKENFQELRQWTVRTLLPPEEKEVKSVTSNKNSGKVSESQISQIPNSQIQQFKLSPLEQAKKRPLPPKNPIYLEDFEPSPQKNIEFFDDLNVPVVFLSDRRTLKREPYSLDTVAIDFQID